MIPAGDRLDIWEQRSVGHWRSVWGVPRVVAYRTVASTNDVARTLAEQGEPEMTVVVADQQTAGRGRFGRTWTAPPGRALLFSTFFRPGTEAPAPAAALRIGLAAARAIQHVTGVVAGIKWPNDVVAPDGRKLAGVLCETVGSPPGTCLVAGVGINANQSSDDWPPDLRGGAVSLFQVSGCSWPRSALAGELVRLLRRAAPRIAAPLNEQEQLAFAARDSLRGREVTIDGRPAGLAAGLTAEGALLVQDAGGLRPIWSGTLRAAAVSASAH